ncbi:thrombospondin type-1 domain-containing protein 4 isoform X2 [Phyllopteryx taeniolatus]|uniref:thrombospondin type-1 domain-containing protein 4 isoform X2 n=1 Tax=Phyllopteryx taeniolatus TaxID=161469 RepID=UPI002AD3CE77|nr:thrombospondin type-1 domain-containing protein 4 isoform X2 [Phyllopteryx taeniolatus]
MRLGSIFRLYALWAFVEVATSVTKPAKRKVAGRRSRQVFEAEPVEGVWSVWAEWSDCSQSCGVGVSQRSRNCLPPPPTSPSVSYSSPNWGGHLPGGVGGPVISSMRPYHPSRQHPPHNQLPNPNQGVSLYRSTPPGGDVGLTNPSSPFYQAEYPVANQNRVSVYRSPYHAPSRAYNQQQRTIRRPSNPGALRAAGGGSRRSVSTSREGLPVRRSSPIRPGQFGYGKVPFSLPLHRPSRQARHTANGTASATSAPKLAAGDDNDEEEEEDEEGTTTAAPATTTTPQPHVRSEQRRVRVPPSPHFLTRSPSSSSSVLASHRRFDWRAVTAPPPPASPHLHPNSQPASPYFPYSSPLHRPLHMEWAPHPGFGAQAQQPSNMYPLQHPHRQHMGAEAGGPGGRTPQNYRCSGPEKEYRRCFLQVCAGATLDSRAEQCAAFNTKEFMDRLYEWEPFTEVGPEKQCELTCRPAGYRFYVRQAERVRDGTPCFNVTSNDVCVGGQCLTEGCDGILGSGSVLDKCGICGGRDSSCQKVTGSFQNVTVPLGYHKILDIPARATFINITERRASPNYLAMRSGTGASVVNGRWAVDPPGEYQAGGTTFTYARPKAQAEGEEDRGESLRAPGPTRTQLQLYIIFHQQNPGIDYEFYIPVEKKEGETPRERQPARAPLRSPLTVSIEEPPPAAPPLSMPSFPPSSSVFAPPLSYHWNAERSRPRASAPNRNARIPPRTDLPLDTQPPFVWRRGALSQCSVSCGKVLDLSLISNGVMFPSCGRCVQVQQRDSPPTPPPIKGHQYRDVLCVDRHTDEEVPERKCDSAAKPVPEEEPCNVHACPPFWEASAWSECSVSCGPGVQQRQLQCRQSFGNRSTMVHPQRCANLTPPESTQACQLPLCSHWEVGSDWSTCSVDCGVGKRTRSVRCVSDQGSVVSDMECSSRVRPLGSEECNMGPCVTNWYSSAWSGTCSAQCGPGVQKREVVCLTRGGVREGEGAGDCIGEKPAELKACNGGPCVSITMWYSGPWTQCNVLCGNGTQRRDFICVQKMGNDFTVVPSSECAQMDKPAAVQQCDMGDCHPQWFTTEWSACSRSCGKGLQMREVRCLTADKKHSQNCDVNIKPEQEQVCNTIPCSPQVTDENCRDRRHNCVMVVQARLCVYSYYKTACCASCTHSALRAKRH